MTRHTIFEKELTRLLNCCSAENESNTPDFILAQYLIGCLATWNVAVQQRETWYGRDARLVLTTELEGKKATKCN